MLTTVPGSVIYSRGSSDLRSIPNLAWEFIISSPIHAQLRSRFAPLTWAGSRKSAQRTRAAACISEHARAAHLQPFSPYLGREEIRVAEGIHANPMIV